MKQDIITRNTRNSKGQYHGYQEWYNLIDVLRFRGNWKNGSRIGYSDWHNTKETLYHIR